MWKKKKNCLVLNLEEKDCVLHSLMEFRNKLLRQGRYTDCVDDVIIKLVNAPVRNI